MIKFALQGLLARKLRTALTGFAVVIGVAFVAGTFVFTDTIDASFKDLFERTQKGTDVSVQARLAVEQDFAEPPMMPVNSTGWCGAGAWAARNFGGNCWSGWNEAEKAPRWGGAAGKQ